VRTSIVRTLLPALALLLAPGAARAESASLKPAGSIYADAKDVAFRGPEGVACRDGGAVVVADTANSRLVVFGRKAGAPTATVEVKLAQLTAPRRVHLDSKGNVLALDGKTRRIVRVGQDGAFAGNVAYGGAPAPDAVQAGAFDIDSADHLYVLDLASRAVLELEPGDRVVRRIELPKQRAASFTDVAVDAAGTVYAVDAVSAVVFAADKAATAFAPRSKPLKGNMSFPAALSASRGKLWVVDGYGHGVAVVAEDGSYQGRQLGLGAAEGLVAYPGQLCVTASGEAFIADSGNNRVQRFSLVN
jgi:streptogramin lyase